MPKIKKSVLLAKDSTTGDWQDVPVVVSESSIQASADARAAAAAAERSAAEAEESASYAAEQPAYEAMEAAQRAAEAAEAAAQDASAASAAAGVAVQIAGTAKDTADDAAETAENAVSTASAAAVAAVPAAVTDWLDDNVTPVGSAVTVDASLSIEGSAADAKKTGEGLAELKEQVGEPYVSLVPLEVTIVKEKVFASRSAGSTMAFNDNTIYHYILLDVEPGEKYSIRTYFSSGSVANRYYIYYTDDNDTVVVRRMLEADYSGPTTFDQTVPNGATQLYIQGYSQASLIDSRMAVSKYVDVSYREVIDTVNTRSATTDNGLTNLLNGLMVEDYTPVNIGLGRGFMHGDGSIDTSRNDYVFTRGLQICAPLSIAISGDTYAFAINQYDSYNYSSARLVKNWKNYSAVSPVVVYSDTYPIYLRLGIKRVDGADITSAEYADIISALTFKSYTARPLFASISMFPKFAITGCSWDAGTIYESSDGHVTRTGAGWAEALGRRNGCQVGNYAIGASSLLSWFNNDSHSGGFPALLTADTYPLYILTEGNSNDANVFVLNDSGYSPSTPSTTTYYLGSIEDISTRQDYHDYPCTFYGYYGRVIEMIQEHAPNTRIIVSSPDTTIITTDIRKALRTACREVAQYYGLPYMDIESDPYYDTYVNALVGSHPTAPTYSGWAMAVERLFARVVQDNLPYFNLYSGRMPTAVPVAWEPVELT